MILYLAAAFALVCLGGLAGAAAIIWIERTRGADLERAALVRGAFEAALEGGRQREAIKTAVFRSKQVRDSEDSGSMRRTG